ncbi:DinB family protein [Alkalihalobacillus sp. AL-G]|uniref:DinB family protein n=1 Tax=Alkalihalobacillus sp. AL-G TaxID=2926399 RepID=UPI00272BEDB3|nr:DinB family protein [Alkalihalobacillus sp. AL-G]WLD93598.1 DinB family protein [Alkalihalobacillus sp. AL-G]
MDRLIFKQFELTRGFFLKTIQEVSETTAKVQPDGFNNTIHWQIGHVLTVAEQVMFGFPDNTTHLPTNYTDLFGKGTKPADWKGGVPAIKDLSIQLTDQLDRLQQIPAERFNKTLKEPFFGLETFGEMAGFALLHEAGHMGQIKAMNRIIEHTRVKS